MRKLFWGFFFIYLNFNLNLNQYSLNILPNFVGYILLLQGMKQLEEESRFFRRARPFAVGMAVYEAILWIGAGGIADHRQAAGTGSQCGTAQYVVCSGQCRCDCQPCGDHSVPAVLETDSGCL